jgi:hypothetical protein
MSAEAITICSVSYGSAGHLRLNRAQLLAANVGTTVHWRVADNTPAEHGERLRADEGFELYPGVPQGDEAHGAGSYQHGRALNTLLREIRTRYVLIMDPDFYLRLPDALARITRHMREHGLAFLGVPWHPRWYTKYRDFPCVHCWFIDTERVPIATLDFVPDCADNQPAPRETLPNWPQWRRWSAMRVMLSALDRGARAVFGRAPWRMAQRCGIGAARDTGFRVYARHAVDKALRAEVAVAVRSTQPLPSGDTRYVTSLWNRLVEAMLPDCLRFVPRRATAAMPAAALRFDACKPEHFMWRGAYFGFHVREFPRADSERAARLASIQQALASAG